ncbi:V-type ATP synthase subunit I domain-containing protein [Glycomyces niveus]|jgi:hypothetical protein|uniref:DUF4352 domain-containing protein n=1 Tax=Glycomyces niveus TaxID=2820287 RepID=A0ABS3U401_9ACTN|nr:hypothetical protein [Glycomyces sp. NEAU-S30]MBO3733504.1 hypothetical protein [Glycomyces sp. NEAU-S30]
MSQPPASPPPFPQEPPGPPPYYPPPPGPPAEQWGERPKTLGVLALVFGAAALLFGLIPVAGIFIGGLFGVAAIVLGILGIFKSHKLMSIIGIALAVVGLIVTVIVTIAVGKAAEDIIEDWPTDYETSDDGEDSDQGHGDAPQDQVVDGTDPTAPLPAGSEVTTGNWTVVISEVVPDATDQVMESDPFNVAPPEGYQFFLFTVDATYNGEASSTAWADLLFGVFIEDSVYTEACGFIPDHLSYAPEVFAGGTATGDYCITVPSAGAETAAIGVEDYWSSAPRLFVAAE